MLNGITKASSSKCLLFWIIAAGMVYVIAFAVLAKYPTCLAAGYSIPGLTGLFVAVFSALMWRLVDSKVTASQQPVPDSHLYRLFLVFLGILLALLGVACSLTVALFISQKLITVPFAPASGVVGEQSRGNILSLSILMGILGAVFFTANSLSQKASGQTEKFDREAFWGGFAFRIGESVLFVLVFFLFFCSTETLYKSMNYLPILSLLLGMFVKSGERLVFGIAERLFAVMNGLLPPVAGADASPGTPRNLKATRVEPFDPNAPKYLLAWEEPLTGASHASYRICKMPNATGVGSIVAEVKCEKTELELAGSQIDTACQYYVVSLNEGGVEGAKSNLVTLP